MPPKTKKPPSVVDFVHPFKNLRPLPFHAARQRMAEHIRGGGLVVPKEYAQADPSSFSLLAVINEGGMLTTNSQDAIEPLPVQRAYVEGLMLPVHARAYLRWITVNTGMVAFAPTVTYCDNGRAAGVVDNTLPAVGIAVTRKREGAAAGEWKRASNLKAAFGSTWEHEAKMMINVYGMLPRKDAVLVCTFDPVWGRSALSKDGLFPAVIHALRVSAPKGQAP